MAVGEIKPGQDDLRLGRERKVFKQDKVCYSWLAGNCKRGDNCKFLHSYFFGAPFVTFLTQLTGHEKAIGGFVFPPNSGKFYSGRLEGILRVWDSQTGECTNAIDLGGEIGCLHSEGPWVFAGLPNAVKAWNNLTSAELTLSGPRGQVHALTVGNQILFAATQHGVILGWKFAPATNSFESATLLAGHTGAVVTLVSQGDKLYSGSMDHTIRVWDLGTFECTQILECHTSVVMSLLFWDQFLLSCSLDMTVKVWVAASCGSLEVTYTQNENQVVFEIATSVRVHLLGEYDYLEHRRNVVAYPIYLECIPVKCVMEPSLGIMHNLSMFSKSFRDIDAN